MYVLDYHRYRQRMCTQKYTICRENTHMGYDPWWVVVQEVAVGSSVTFQVDDHFRGYV